MTDEEALAGRLARIEEQQRDILAAVGRRPPLTLETLRKLTAEQVSELPPEEVNAVLESEAKRQAG